jgi:hypothetical protein
MNIQKIIRNPRAIKAMLGMSKEEFDNLKVRFEEVLIETKLQNRNRLRKIGGGIKGRLPTGEDKLFFVLFYAKVYTTFDVLGSLFDKGRGRSCEAIHLYMKILKKVLGRELVLPERKIASVEEFFKKFPDVKDVILDGVERRIQRSKDKKKQNKQYSGKKKAHTRKNVIVTDLKKKILVISKTKSGRRHDKRLLDKMILKIPDNVTKLVDSGFQGLDKIFPNVLIPKKNSKKNPLTSLQKEENRIISSFRVVVEHAIGGIKRFGVLSQTLRNRKAFFDDLVIEVCSGLWNYHLKVA